MATEKATVPMEISLQHSSVECQTEEHRRTLHSETQRRYRQAKSVRETAEQKREHLSRKKHVAEKRGSETGESTTTRLKNKDHTQALLEVKKVMIKGE